MTLILFPLNFTGLTHLHLSNTCNFVPTGIFVNVMFILSGFILRFAGCSIIDTYIDGFSVSTLESIFGFDVLLNVEIIIIVNISKTDSNRKLLKALT